MTGTSEGVKKAWDKRGRGRKSQRGGMPIRDSKAIVEDVKSNKPVTRSEYKQLKSEILGKVYPSDKLDLSELGKDDFAKSHNKISKDIGSTYEKYRSDLGSSTTKSLEEYRNNDYIGINSYLRYGKNGGQDTDKIKDQINKIDSAFIKKTSEPLTTFRVVRGEDIVDKYNKIGTIIDEKGYLSTSMRGDVAFFGADSEHSISLQIEVPKGTPFVALSVATTGGEDELLLPRNGQLKITEVNDVTQTKYRLDNKGEAHPFTSTRKYARATYVLPDSNQKQNDENINSSVITNAGTSEGVKKAWLKRQRARPDLIADIKSGKAITKSEYKYMMKQLTAPMPAEEKYRTMKDAKNSKTVFNDKLMPDEKKVYGLEADIKNHLWKKGKELNRVLNIDSMNMMERASKVSKAIDNDRKHKISKTSNENGEFYYDTPEDQRLHLISSLIENPKWLAEKDPLIYNKIVRAATSGALGSKAKTAIKLKPVEIKDDKAAWKREYVDDDWKKYQKESYKEFATSESGKEVFSDVLKSDKLKPTSDKYDSGIEFSDETKALKTTTDFYNTMIDKFGVEDYTDQNLPIENKRLMVTVLEKVNKVLPNFPLPHIKISDTGAFDFSEHPPLAVTETHNSGVILSEVHFGIGKNAEAQKTLCNSVDNRMHAPGTANFEAVFAHELGHVLEMEIAKSDSEEAIDAYDELVSTFDHDNAISSYSLAGDDEFFAEHFASAILPNKYTKDNPNVVNVKKFINRISKKAGGVQI